MLTASMALAARMPLWPDVLRPQRLACTSCRGTFKLARKASEGWRCSRCRHEAASPRARYLVKVLEEAGELDRMRAEAERRERSGRKTLVTDGTRVAAGRVTEQIAEATGASPRTVARVLAEATDAEPVRFSARGRKDE